MDLSYKSYYNENGRYISIPEFYDGKSVFITEGDEKFLKNLLNFTDFTTNSSHDIHWKAVYRKALTLMSGNRKYLCAH